MTGQRRKFERVDVPRDAQVQVLDPQGHQVGVLRQVGRGGFMMEPKGSFTSDGKIHKLAIYDRHEDIRVKFDARSLYADPNLAGFQFIDLDADNAVELGILIGKFYEAGKA
jgi:hypothetical protein